MAKYEVKGSQIHGVGLFAKQDISVGEIIILEEPLLSMPEDLNDESVSPKLIKRILKTSDKAFNRLRQHCLPLHGKDTAKLTKDAIRKNTPEAMKLLLSTLEVASETFTLSDSGKRKRCLFDDFARLNHACKPSAQASWLEEKNLIVVKATKEIAQGEEIFISYLSALATPFLQKTDRKRELAGWFTCKCELCALTSLQAVYPEIKVSTVYNHLTALATIRSHFFEPGEIVHFFASRPPTEAAYETANKICACSVKVKKSMAGSVVWLEKNTSDLGFAHDCLALAHEVDYLFHAAEALQQLKGDENGKGYSEEYVDAMLSNDDFKCAFQAKLKELTVLVTCLGIWHNRSKHSLQEVCMMAYHDKSWSLLREMEERLRTMGVTFELKEREDGQWDWSVDHLREIKDELQRMGVTE